MIFTQKQSDFIKKEIGINVPANENVKFDKETIDKISLETLYIESDESMTDNELSERGKIAVSIDDMLAGIKASL